MGVKVVTRYWDNSINGHKDDVYTYPKADSWNLVPAANDESGYVEVVEDSGSNDARVVGVLKDWHLIETIENDDDEE